MEDFHRPNTSSTECSSLNVHSFVPFNYHNSNQNSFGFFSTQKPTSILNTRYGEIQEEVPTTQSILDLNNQSLKRSYDSRSSSASPDSNQSTPRKRSLYRSPDQLPSYPISSWNNSTASNLPSNLVNINILNATYFKCKNDLMVIHLRRSKIQNNLKYLIENVLPTKRSKIPYLKVKQEHILEVMNNANFFYKNVFEEVQQNYQQLQKIVGNDASNNIDAVGITIGNLLLKSKQILRNVDMLRDLDTNMLSVVAHMFDRILFADLDSKYNSLVVQIQCWLLDLFVNILPGYIHRIMKVSAAREARGTTVKECRSRKRCLSDWLTVAKSLNGGKIDLCTTLNRFTAVAGVSAILQYSEKPSPVKEIILRSFNDEAVQKTYTLCQHLEGVIEPLRQVQSILTFCLDENSSSLMLDQVHNPLFEKRLYSFRTGASSTFPKKLIGELEKHFHHDFIQGPTFFATQQYERRCVTCHTSLGQQCLLCTGCNLVRYCGDSCAKADEFNHEKICSMDRFEILKTFLEKVSDEKNCHEIEVV